MRIKVRFLCVDILPGKGNGEIEIADGTTIADALAICAKQSGIDMPMKQLLESMLLVNSAPAQPNRVLRDGEELSVIRTLKGG